MVTLMTRPPRLQQFQLQEHPQQSTEDRWHMAMGDGKGCRTLQLLSGGVNASTFS